jgi:RNA polymerase sigma factor (sigma-70 family)
MKGMQVPSKPLERTSVAERSALLQAWQERRERHALERLVAIEMRVVKSLLRRRCPALSGAAARAHGDASDFAQSAARRLLERDELPRFESPDRLRAYLMKTAQNRLFECLDAGRRLRSETTASGAHSGGIGSLERREQIRAALPRLAEPEREIVELLFFRGLSRREVGDALGVSKQTVSDRSLRALDHLRRILSS